MEPGIHCILQRESAVHQRPPSKFRSTPLDIAMKTKANHNANSQTYGAEQLLQVGHTLVESQDVWGFGAALDRNGHRWFSSEVFEATDEENQTDGREPEHGTRRVIAQGRC
jgi:hypothetical protein